MENDFIISRYTRQNALEDGVLIDVTEQAKETGILLPAVITDHLHNVLEDIPESSIGQDWRGRLHDVLWMTFLKRKSMQQARDVSFPAEVKVIINARTQTLWSVVDGDGLTIM